MSQTTAGHRREFEVFLKVLYTCFMFFQESWLDLASQQPSKKNKQNSCALLTTARAAIMAATGVLPFVRGIDFTRNDFKVNIIVQ